MRPFIHNIIRTLAILLAGTAAFYSNAFAQGTNPNKVPDVEQQADQNQQLEQRQLEQGNQPEQQKQQAAPKPDPKEEAAYKAFYDADPKDADNRIKLGQDFLQKYPNSRYAESVYAGVTQAYFQKQDWKDFYANADKALALNPDDAPLLAMVGWVIPHVYDANSSDALQSLDKAEKYEKHAIDLTNAMQKPVNMTDDQFAKSKNAILGEAHSGLGIVYFRKQQFDDSIKELQQGTQLAASPDPTDFFVMGLDLQSLQRYNDAVDAFNHCAQIPGGLQDRCKQSADAAKKQVK
jgi:tetratricopeptide (TPR) repeat protein